MKIINLFFILICLLISLHQNVSLTELSPNEKISIQFDELLFESLNFLQQKLMNNTFNHEDMHVLGVLMKFILQMNEKKNQRLKKERTVYWLLRQGR